MGNLYNYNRRPYEIDFLISIVRIYTPEKSHISFVLFYIKIDKLIQEEDSNTTSYSDELNVFC